MSYILQSNVFKDNYSIVQKVDFFNLHFLTIKLLINNFLNFLQKHFFVMFGKY